MAEELTIRDMYHQAVSVYTAQVKNVKSGEKGPLWKSIVMALYNRCGQELGFGDFYSFLGAISRYKNTYCKKGKKEVRMPKSPVHVVHVTHTATSRVCMDLNRESELGEGSTFFTNWQVANYGLNPDSY